MHSRNTHDRIINKIIDSDDKVACIITQL